MRVFRSEDFLRMENPTPGSTHRSEILTPSQKTKDLGGIFGLMVVGGHGNYHYHEKRESIIIIIQGDGAERHEGGEIPVKAGDVIFIPPGEKHMLINKSDKDLRYLEFFTHPPVKADFIEVK
jgi:uncharacterized cupin superfamily protein